MTNAYRNALARRAYLYKMDALGYDVSEVAWDRASIAVMTTLPIESPIRVAKSSDYRRIRFATEYTTREPFRRVAC